MKINFNLPPGVAHEANGLMVRYAPSRRQLASWRWRVLVLLVLSPLLWFAGRLLYGAVYADMPGFVVMQQTLLKTPLSGRLVRASAIGTPVQAGDTVAQLDNEVLQKEQAALIAQLALAAKSKPTVQAAHSQMASSLIALAQSRVDYRQQQYTRLQTLLSQNAATQTEVDQAHTQLLTAQTELHQTRQRPPEVASVANAATHVEQRVWSQRLSQLNAQLGALQLKSVEAGTVAQVFAKPGEWVQENTEVINVRLHGTPQIEVFVAPSWAKLAKVGRWASVHFLDGYSHRAQVKEVKMLAQRLPSERSSALTGQQHSIVALLSPEPALPVQYQINVLPVNVQFDLDWHWSTAH